MNNQEYEQKLQERWEDLHSLGDSKPSAKECFDYAFAAAYALGKQEKDAEGEEMLTVEADLIRELYQRAKEIEEESKRVHSPMVAAKYRGVQRAIEDLFGSKCLPDESESPKLSKVEKVGKDCNVDSLPTNVDSSDDCKAEPKFKVGDIVRFKYCCTTYQIDGFKISDGVMLYQVGEVWAEESDLEPYTEPEKESRNLSQETANCDKQFDNILKDSFRNERRLNIATTIMAGVMANPDIIKSRGDLKAISDKWLASRTLELADTLIAECEKGGMK